jgi:Putative Ig domain
MRTVWIIPLLLGLTLAGYQAGGAVTSVELRQDLTPYNFLSQSGVPISTTTNDPPGSNGLMPTNNESSGSVNLPTANQFQGLLSFGAVPGLTSNEWINLTNYADLEAGSAAFSGGVAEEMGLPVGKSGNTVALVLRRVEVGAPYMSQGFSYLFGSTIAPPVTDESGKMLPTNVLNTTYWLPQPYFTTTNTDVSEGYYWSPNAKLVFAIQSGPIAVTWVKAAAYSADTLPDYANPNGAQSFLTNGASIYEIYTARYLVSSSPVKRPEKMYWTESPFDKTGHLVSVPAATVSAVNIVYNRGFPQYATNLYSDPYITPQVNPTNSLQEPRTLWLQNGVVHAFNIQGRVFVELLAELQPEGARRFLGFEIVDVYQEPAPTDVTVELGERVPAYQDGRDDSALYPAPVQGTSSKFYYQRSSADGLHPTLYATYETANLNDFQVHWLITGVAGLQWPYLFDRYDEVWPADAAKYVDYLRPLAGTEAQAKETAVQLPGDEAPQIPYQDPLPSPLGAKLSAGGLFYTFLDLAHPAHRTLLQFAAGDQVAFERVFSWLDLGIKTNAIFADSVATNLTAWNLTHEDLNFTDPSDTPHVVTDTVNVGDRIEPPSGELGAAGDYLAGYILQTNGNSFNPGAYVDPFALGFDKANQGAIIPVNAIPGQDHLDVWWFRSDHADQARGFQPSYWPSVIGHYTLQWPRNPDEIILASNDGSGPLDSLQAKGSIYRQPDPTLPGYNPNEEHALMLAGQAYALRDDLNMTNSPNYSSAPFVLLDYTGSDGRPAMRVWHVRRQKPETGIFFDYVVDAGSLLQAPMPLPLMPPPTAGSGQYAVNYDTEPPSNSQDLPVGWSDSFTNSSYAHYAAFTFEDRKHEFWVYRGLHSGLPGLAAGHYNASNNTFDALPDATAVVGEPFTYYIQVSRRTESLHVEAHPLPDGLTVKTTDGIAIAGVPLAAAASQVVTVSITDTADGSAATTTFNLEVANTGTIVTQGPLVITATNQYAGVMESFTNRPPFLAEAPTTTNSFTMRFYYKTLPSFDWPGAANPPAPGSIVPYLRPVDASGNFVGDEASSDTPSLDIVYRPVWPSRVNGQPLSTLYAGQTLTVAAKGMAAIRGQSSARVLYQQSIGLDITDAPDSVVLYDPTVQKTSNLAAQSLSGLPASVVSRPYLGKYYFPNLPPNLANRVLYDPNTGNLLLKGQFVDEPVGEKYLLLNLLRGADLEAVNALCSVNDSQFSAWTNVVGHLSTPVYTFHEDPNAPGSYVDDPYETVARGVGDIVEVTNSDTQVDSYALGATGPGAGYVTYIVGNGHNPAHAGEPVSIYILRVSPELYPGELKVIPDANPLSEKISFQHTSDLAGRSEGYEYDWRIAPPVDGQPPTSDPTNWTVLTSGSDLTHFTLDDKAGIQALSDNYLRLRYRSIDPLANPASTNWSDWTEPQLAEGWIKRVLAGINPFNQRTSELFNNPVNTTASIISQAGHRWEGDVALNQEELNNYGLIEIYETVLHRGEALSINAAGGGINYGPANDALLLAAGYLNDLCMFLGNDAWANSLNPTIGFGTADKTYGSIATALFTFKGEVSSLLDQDLALLRGRDDFLSPGVRLPPVYNRLYWNYTRGIDSGEVIYALNYNLKDENYDGVVNAADAAILYPQGHGDAYGQYLTALMNYYSLLLNPKFDWVPRIETVSVLGAAVSVDYEDERKFAAAAGALARTGRQTFDLTWRRDYQADPAAGWDYMGASRQNLQKPYQDGTNTDYVTRYWGLDHWASRVGQGAYLNWVVGNAILPPVDPDPTHEGIQKVDRTTVPELAELPATETELQQDMDNAEAGFTPQGLPRNSTPFDINPLEVTGPDPKSHFEQIYDRAVRTLNNAVVAFNDAQNVTQLLRSEQDSLTDFQVGYTNQEIAFNNQLIELYGTPYPDDMGPGKTYSQDYAGPDLLHYMYVDNPDTNTYNDVLPDPTTGNTFYVDVQNLPDNWLTQMFTTISDLGLEPSTSPNYTNAVYSIPFNIGPNGFFEKPPNWTGKRESPGKIQQAISDFIAAQNRLRKAVASETYDKQSLDVAMMAAKSQLIFETNQVNSGNQNSDLQKAINDINEGYNVESKTVADLVTGLDDLRDIASDDVPTTFIFGLANGGDVAKAALVPLYAGIEITKAALLGTDLALFIGTSAATTALQNQILEAQKTLANSQLAQDTKDAVLALANQEFNMQGDLFTINEALRSLDDAQRAFQAMAAEGNRIQQQRLTFRQHAAALIQGYRTRDAAFLIFQNEKLERYNTLFSLAAEYGYLAAQAYDYDTGLLNTQQGRQFLSRIVSSCALGVIVDGQPQYAGSDTGDPGLSSALAEMKADWDVLKGRLGFNNPDGYGTTVSLRTENYRILPAGAGDAKWKDVLEQGRVANLLDDTDVKRCCMQVDDGSGLPVPGIVLSFSTAIADGLNLFGKPLAAGDHNFSPSSFATKIFAVGVDLDGYVGMDNPSGITGTGGFSPPDPTLDPNGLAATPYVYLIPVGTDSMRSPPLGDVSTIRTWNVHDVTIPLPFNISASDFSSAPFYTANDSLSEPLFSIRKFQAFRPVSTVAAFNLNLYGGNGGLAPSEYTNSRLIGRSVWNSQWKLVIPGKTLLNDPNEGLERFIQTVKDVKLHFVTYSYAGN